MTVWQDAGLVLIGLGGGLAVGSGFVAFIIVLDIIPRLTQLTHSQRYIHCYEWALVCGALWFTVADFFSLSIDLPVAMTAVVGLLAGIFVGTLAAGLTEVLNVFPILAKRLQVDQSILAFLMAMVFGKTLGSLLQWILHL
ncbi:stage V sporulation protein AB [Brevibacillus sp. SYP-B805]|uniref:stage V sporulation protein AB n=1 Tax=Brevibacillus sp. SYP-B805 TaxID=1578199 RepID=UPI0013EA6C43|nr:stage V sporulation protein AB [Brevibacillus sp. SYP-B805]NGQ94643.1 stage V sporulation protein AB [Brevibacillus sp. SYP-B805]